MSKSFEESYKAEIGKNIPDLWDRIVAGIEADETEQYAAFHEEQQKLDETKILMEIYEATELSYKAEEASYETEKSSYEAEEASYETEESSYEAEETPYQEEEVKEVSSKVVSWKKHFRRLMPVAAAACILGVFVIPATILLVQMAGMKSMDSVESAPDMMMDAAAEENYMANTQAGEAEDKFAADNMLTGNLGFKDDYDAGAMEDKRSEEGMVAGSDSGEDDTTLDENNEIDGIVASAEFLIVGEVIRFGEYAEWKDAQADYLYAPEEEPENAMYVELLLTSGAEEFEYLELPITEDGRIVLPLNSRLGALPELNVMYEISLEQDEVYGCYSVSFLSYTGE